MVVDFFSVDFSSVDFCNVDFCSVLRLLQKEVTSAQWLSVFTVSDMNSLLLKLAFFNLMAVGYPQDVSAAIAPLATSSMLVIVVHSFRSG